MCLDRGRSRTWVCALCTATARQAYWLEFKTLRPRDGKQQAASVHVSTVADATSLPLLTFLSHVRERLNNSWMTSLQYKLMAAMKAEQSSSMINGKAKKNNIDNTSAAKSHPIFQNKIIRVTESWQNSKHVRYFRLWSLLCTSMAYLQWTSPLVLHCIESEQLLYLKTVAPQCKKECFHRSFLPAAIQHSMQAHPLNTVRYLQVAIQSLSPYYSTC